MARESLKELGPTTLSWSAILGGSFIALGAMVLLSWLGLAIGLTTIDTAAKAAGIWFAIWTFLVPILALFLGGLVAGRFGGILNRPGGAIHGAVTWGVTTLVTGILTVMVLGGLIGGVMNLGGAVVQATGSAISGVSDVQMGPAAQALGVDAQALLQPINQDRAQRGLPPLQAQNFQVALQDAVDKSLQQGRLDREILVTALVENTQVSRATAEQVANDVESSLQQVGTDVTAAADTAVDAMATSSWYAFASLLLSLGAAMGAGMIAVSRTQKAPLHEPRRTTVLPPHGGEVYP